ncbi:MAG: histidine--tRNA ligase [Spirochaetes bacterium RIFOXYC1_FULL_54_7]|nr:MAG: histidine--tRNA ligase [Spirochaetes bacterium RIFOXYC1_FULL_54_7]
MIEIIQPRVLKGFRDFMPEAESERAALTEVLTKVFRSFGFVPIDTPVLEYAEILLGKAGGETEKQVYRFTDHGGRDVAMRFDLTVPFARFMAEHYGELYLPFKRYHLAKVWRGENTQRGRYREFMQCDVDIVGVDSAAADFEILAVIRQAMETLGVPDSTVHLSHRGVFNRFLARAGIAERSVEVLRIVDKLSKIGVDETKAQLTVIAGGKAAEELLEFIAGGEAFNATLERITRLAGGPNPDSDRLAEIHAMAEACSIGDRVQLAPSITRGLDYYTGVVFETFLDAMPEIGSVCSGGRYNDLASLYTNQRLPGVGTSVGLDRLLAALNAMGRKNQVAASVQAVIFNLENSLMTEYQAAAHRLRTQGISCEVYTDQRKPGQQYTYADRKGAAFAILRGKEEKAKDIWVLKNMKTRDSSEHPDCKALASAILAAVSPASED